MRSLIFAALLLSACTNEDASREALQNLGFKDIRFTGYNFGACGEDDTFSTGFIAKNTEGRSVSGTVCCGLLKGCTVRF